MELSLEPVLINSTDQSDDVTLVEAQLSIVLWLKVIQSFTTWLSCRKRQTHRGRKNEQIESFS